MSERRIEYLLDPRTGGKVLDGQGLPMTVVIDTTQESAPPTLAEKIEQIRSWLRRHGDYHVTVDLWDLYGTVGVVISHHNTTLKQFHGKHFEKRLDEILTYIHSLDEGK